LAVAFASAEIVNAPCGFERVDCTAWAVMGW
jgi:hypothetical protein